MHTITVEMTPDELQVAMSATMVMGTVAASEAVRETCMGLYVKLTGIRVVAELGDDAVVPEPSE